MRSTLEIFLEKIARASCFKSFSHHTITLVLQKKLRDVYFKNNNKVIHEAPTILAGIASIIMQIFRKLLWKAFEGEGENSHVVILTTLLIIYTQAIFIK